MCVCVCVLLPFEILAFLSLLHVFDRIELAHSLNYCSIWLAYNVYMRWRRNDKGDSLNASYYHIVNPLTAVGSEVSHFFSSNENTIIVGAQHALEPLTTLKARVNNAGKASALVQHECRPKSFFTVSGEVDTKAIEKTAKAGLALALKS